MVKRPGHPMADCRGYIYEHRLVASEMLGRTLRRGEVVHHINQNKLDNRPENLEVLSRAEHNAEHAIRNDLRRLGEPNPLVSCACDCGTAFLLFDADGRPRRFVSGHNVGRDPITRRFVAR